MEFTDVIKERYACKKYDGRMISEEQLNAILEAGRLAPTAKNLQGSTSTWCAPKKAWRRSMP